MCEPDVHCTTLKVTKGKYSDQIQSAIQILLCFDFQETKSFAAEANMHRTLFAFSDLLERLHAKDSWLTNFKQTC